MCIPDVKKDILLSKCKLGVKREISVSELKLHNTPYSAWSVVNDNQVVDITQFSKRHPGGDIILLGAGKDASILFRTYHPKGVPKALLRKLEVGVIKDVSQSYYDWSSDFYPTLCERVIKRLKSLNRHQVDLYTDGVQACVEIAK